MSICHQETQKCQKGCLFTVFFACGAFIYQPILIIFLYVPYNMPLCSMSIDWDITGPKGANAQN